MKRFAFFMLVAACFLSCQKDTMVIKGQIDPSLELNGKEVKLVVDDGQNKNEYFAEISDNAFRLSKKVPFPQLTTLNVADLGDYTIVLEKGELFVDMVANNDSLKPFLAYIYATGTPNNDIINDYNTFCNEFEASLDEAQTEVETETLYNDYTLTSFEMAMKDITMPANEYIFSNIIYNLSLEQREEAFAAMTEEQLSRQPFADISRSTKAQRLTAVGNKFTDISFQDPQGEPHNLSDFVGQTDYLLLDIWATWCPPCRALLPKLKTLYQKHKAGNHFQIISMSVDQEQDKWKNFLQEHQDYSWIQVLDTDEEADKYGVITIPTTVLIDAEGTIIGRNLSEEELDKILIK